MKWLLGLAVTGLTIASFLIPPAGGFPDPELARMIFFHLPAALGASVFAIFASVASWAYLAKKTEIWDFRAVAATEMALVLSVATMLTGILFSRVQWGQWWSWDPRQTSFLIVLLLLGAYFAVRMGFDDEKTRAKASAAYSTLALLPILFLIFVFPRLPNIVRGSLHPSTTIQKGEFSRDYYLIVGGMFVCLLLVSLWLYRRHVEASLLVHQAEENGNLETAGNDPASYPVGTVVPLREQD